MVLGASASTSTHSCHQQTRRAETSRGSALKRPGSNPEQHKYFASSSKALPVPITFPGDAYGAWMSLKPSRAAQIRAVSCLQQPGSSNELLGPPFLAICPLALVARREESPLASPSRAQSASPSMAQGGSAEPSRGTRLFNKWKEIINSLPPAVPILNPAFSHPTNQPQTTKGRAPGLRSQRAAPPVPSPKLIAPPPKTKTKPKTTRLLAHLQRRQVGVELGEAVQHHGAALAGHLQPHAAPKAPRPPAALEHLLGGGRGGGMVPAAHHGHRIPGQPRDKAGRGRAPPTLNLTP